MPKFSSTRRNTPETIFVMNESDQPVYVQTHVYSTHKSTAERDSPILGKSRRVHELDSAGSRNGDLQKLSLTEHPYGTINANELVLVDENLANAPVPLNVLAFGKCWRRSARGDTIPHQTTYEMCNLNDVVNYMCDVRTRGLQFKEDLNMHDEEIRELKKRNDEIRDENEKLKEFCERIDDCLECLLKGMVTNFSRNPEMEYLGRRETYQDERHLSRSEEKMIVEKRQESLKEENIPYYTHSERESMQPVKNAPLYKNNSRSPSIKKDFSKDTSLKAYKLSNSRSSGNVLVDREWPSKSFDYSDINHVSDSPEKGKSKDRIQSEPANYSKNLMRRITYYVRSGRQLAEVLAENLRSECQRLPDRSIQETELLDSVDDVLFNIGKFLHSISSSDSCVENETVVRRRAAKLNRAISQFTGMMDDSCHSKQRLDKAKQRLTGFLDLSEDLQSERHRLDDVLQFLDMNFDTFTRSCNEAQSKQPSLRQKKSELEQMYRILENFKQKLEPKLAETKKQKAPCKETTEPEIRGVVEGWISHMLQVTSSSNNLFVGQHEQRNSSKTELNSVAAKRNFFKQNQKMSN